MILTYATTSGCRQDFHMVPKSGQGDSIWQMRAASSCCLESDMELPLRIQNKHRLIPITNISYIINPNTCEIYWNWTFETLKDLGLRTCFLQKATPWLEFFVWLDNAAKAAMPTIWPLLSRVTSVLKLWLEVQKCSKLKLSQATNQKWNSLAYYIAQQLARKLHTITLSNCSRLVKA